MLPMYSVSVPVGDESKTISVYCGDVLEFGEKIDILTTSAFRRSYFPMPGSMFGALNKAGISVAALAMRPQIDMRRSCNIWLSRRLKKRSDRFGRIGCIEFLNPRHRGNAAESDVLASLRSYFFMLDIAAANGIPMETVALPLLGSGVQQLEARLMAMPIINECIAALKRNPSIKRICFAERSHEKAELLSKALKSSYNLQALEHTKNAPKPAGDARVFISYSSPDRSIADSLCEKLEKRGAEVWYAPRNVKGPYAAAITDAIADSTHFVVILSENSLRSEHVLNEIDLAFQNLPDKIRFKPLRIDPVELSASFKYYLSRQHWIDATEPPIEIHLSVFADKLLEDR